MADAPGPDAGGEWLYHLPAFLDRVRERGAQRVVESLEGDLARDVEGVLYHHRGARTLGHDATVVWEDDGFSVEVDAVGDRRAWAVFDADADWDVYLARLAGDDPVLAWMSDAEFAAEEADAFDSKEAAIAAGRFSFGLYLASPATFSRVAVTFATADAPIIAHGPEGRQLVPDDGRRRHADLLPAELRPDDSAPPAYLGLVEATFEGGRD